MVSFLFFIFLNGVLTLVLYTGNVIHFTESYEKYVGFHFYTSNSKNIVN